MVKSIETLQRTHCQQYVRASYFTTFKGKPTFTHQVMAPIVTQNIHILEGRVTSSIKKLDSEKKISNCFLSCTFLPKLTYLS